MRQDRRHGEGCEKAFPEVCNGSENLAAIFAAARRNGAHEEWSDVKPNSEEREGESTFSAVPSSSRSNKHDRLMITELLRVVVCVRDCG